MLVPRKKTVFIVDAMAFRRARAESFLNPWAREEQVELISLDPDEAHARLAAREECDMLIYSVGAPPAVEIFAEIQVLHTLRRNAVLVIVTDDENPATIVAAIRSGVQGYFSNSMPPELALQALSRRRPSRPAGHSAPPRRSKPRCLISPGRRRSGISNCKLRRRLRMPRILSSRYLSSMAIPPISAMAPMPPPPSGLLRSLPNGSTPFSSAFPRAIPIRSLAANSA
jgi:CheY-like chemotaxis protein